jgi:LCP family protein required for cell wall assembly
MVVALDFARGKAGVISIPRDVYIDDIPDHHPNRVNVIDYLGEQDRPNGGGPELFSTIIRERMGIPIHHYVRLEFDSFKAVVDALDGVEVEVDCPFSGFILDEGGWLHLEPGAHRLDGNQSMIYVRSRQIGGDLDRARRQQRFVWAVRNQVLNENLIPRLPALYAALSDAIDTDIGFVNALRVARVALDLRSEDVPGFVLGPPDLLQGGWRGGMSVFVPDWDAISVAVQGVFERAPFGLTNTLGTSGERENCP